MAWQANLAGSRLVGQSSYPRSSMAVLTKLQKDMLQVEADQHDSYCDANDRLWAWLPILCAKLSVVLMFYLLFISNLRHYYRRKISI